MQQMQEEGEHTLGGPQQTQQSFCHGVRQQHVAVGIKRAHSLVLDGVRRQRVRRLLATRMQAVNREDAVVDSEAIHGVVKLLEFLRAQEIDAHATDANTCCCTM